MNFGIINNRRPVKAREGGNISNPLFNDARLREIAKQMGLDSKDFGKEAANLWKMLDEMAENDPKAYQEFIHEQIKDGPPMAASTNETGTPSASPRYFDPLPGCVVKCTMVDVQQQEQKLFVNLCAHEIVDMPKNPNSDRDVPRDTRAVPHTSNLQIPLVIGSLRKIHDVSGAACHAVDVVFHPWVLERCEWDANFKREVLKLAIEWIQQDAKIKLTTPTGKFIKSRYKGGLNVGDEIITAKFLIDPETQAKPGSNQIGQRPLSTEKPVVAKLATESPTDLLKEISLRDSDERIPKDEFIIALAGEKKAQQCDSKPQVCQDEVKHVPRPISKKLIEVIEPMQDNQKEHMQKKKPSSVVKKGFLNSSKTSLYPKGSNEGKPASAYVNLLSRSKVVDMNEMQQQRKKTVTDEFQFLKPQTSADRKSTDGEIDHGDHEFEQLCMDADPDLKPRHGSEDKTSTEQLFGDHIDEFAKFLTSHS
ncbi:hypothetical protein Poli38472_003211 [Pythium oligandrum]|uniref:PIH1 N-terminal domain-containing protein n=1 Tax=Pythium oligandrum TaxID=41045 RepID=A0A8K1FCK2_PYTOL|nr:hypothetical protein Poli38472_003211 [Pythium oligandrum]|eukprot:TMW57286.1 hypothetical protein Poli38472_003211 [Pythium oligandrum]